MSAISRRAEPRAIETGSVVLDARAVSVTIGEKTIVSDVDLQVRAGEIVALVGPNGAGKSTLLAALAGDLGHSGAITLNAKNINIYSARELALHRAVLRQDNVVTFPFRVLDVVAMGRSPWRRLSTAIEDERIIGEELVRTDCLQFAHRPFASLSGGERARVSLARVLAQRASLLLLDEPTASLDINYQELVLAIARKAARDGRAVVVVIHDLAAAAAYADKVLLLSEGRTVAFGDPAEVLAPDVLTSVYGHPIRVLVDVSGDTLVVPERYEDEAVEPLQTTTTEAV